MPAAHIYRFENPIILFGLASLLCSLWRHSLASQQSAGLRCEANPQIVFPYACARSPEPAGYMVWQQRGTSTEEYLTLIYRSGHLARKPCNAQQHSCDFAPGPSSICPLIVLTYPALSHSAPDRILPSHRSAQRPSPDDLAIFRVRLQLSHCVTTAECICFAGCAVSNFDPGAVADELIIAKAHLLPLHTSQLERCACSLVCLGHMTSDNTIQTSANVLVSQLGRERIVCSAPCQQLILLNQRAAPWYDPR